MRPPRRAQPIFVLGFHRGGTTFVQRVLNCHRAVTIWGENAGLISHLRSLYEAYAASPAMPVDRTAYRKFDGFADKFIPWASPFSKEDLPSKLAGFVESMYGPRGGSDRYWGFKEIRHCEVEDVEFVHRLFPMCRILLLTRHPKDVVLSRFCVRWSRARTGVNPEEFVRDVVRDYFQRLDAFMVSARRWPASVHLVKYEDIREDRVVPAVFGSLGIPSAGINYRLLSTTVKTIRGSSFGDRGRNVPEHERDGVGRIYNELGDEILSTSTFRSDRAVLAAWYPKVDA
jgi:hypothetical protein